MSQELLDSVNELTTETTNLLAAYTGAKNTIDAKVAAASEASNIVVPLAAQVAADKIEINALSASAKSSEQSAKQISGLDTVEAAIALSLPPAVSSEMRMTIESATGGTVTMRTDANGNQNAMHKFFAIPNKIMNDRFGTNWLPEEGFHPAFKRPDGTVKPWFEIGCYINSSDGSGNYVSAPLGDPYVHQNYDTAKAKCEDKGAGWRMMSNAEWAWVTLFSKLQNFDEPKGNTYYGKSYDDESFGSRVDAGLVGDADGAAATKAGSGGGTWSHSGNHCGVHDLVGNVWEWVADLLLLDGQIIASDRVGGLEESLTPQSCFLDAGNKLNSEKTEDTTSSSVPWNGVGATPSYAPNQLMQQLMIEPIGPDEPTSGRLYYDNTGNRAPRRGGRWGYGSNAGLGALSLSSDRSYSNSDIGSRSAYSE